MSMIVSSIELKAIDGDEEIYPKIGLDTGYCTVLW